MSGNTHLGNLAVELVVEIFSHLTAKDVAHCRRACEHFHAIVDDCKNGNAIFTRVQQQAVANAATLGNTTNFVNALAEYIAQHGGLHHIICVRRWTTWSVSDKFVLHWRLRSGVVHGGTQNFAAIQLARDIMDTHITLCLPKIQKFHPYDVAWNAPATIESFLERTSRFRRDLIGLGTDEVEELSYWASILGRTGIFASPRFPNETPPNDTTYALTNVVIGDVIREGCCTIRQLRFILTSELPDLPRHPLRGYCVRSAEAFEAVQMALFRQLSISGDESDGMNVRMKARVLEELHVK